MFEENGSESSALVFVGDDALGEGTGRTKKEAEQKAAAAKMPPVDLAAARSSPEIGMLAEVMSKALSTGLEGSGAPPVIAAILVLCEYPNTTS